MLSQRQTVNDLSTSLVTCARAMNRLGNIRVRCLEKATRLEKHNKKYTGLLLLYTTFKTKWITVAHIIVLGITFRVQVQILVMTDTYVHGQVT